MNSLEATSAEDTRRKSATGPGPLESVFHDLVRYQIELWNSVDAALQRELSMSLGQFEGLRVISTTDGCRVYDVSELLVITVGGASKLVDRIEASGLCERRANPGDRRSSLISLTESGRRALAAAETVVEFELQARLAAPLTPAVLENFGTALATLRGRS